MWCRLNKWREKCVLIKIVSDVKGEVKKNITIDMVKKSKSCIENIAAIIQEIAKIPTISNGITKMSTPFFFRDAK